MPLIPQSQIQSQIFLLQTEVDFSVQDKLSHFAGRLLGELKEKSAELESSLLRELEDITITYAKTTIDGIIIKSTPVFNEVLNTTISVLIDDADLPDFETEGTALITAAMAEEIEIAPFVCPECPRMYELSEEFRSEFAGLLIPELTYTPVTFNYYSPSFLGCFYGEPEPVTVYFSVDKYFQFNNVPPGDNTFAPDGCYFLVNTEYYNMIEGVKDDLPTLCVE